MSCSTGTRKTFSISLIIHKGKTTNFTFEKFGKGVTNGITLKLSALVKNESGVLQKFKVFTKFFKKYNKAMIILTIKYNKGRDLKPVLSGQLRSSPLLFNKCKCNI